MEDSAPLESRGPATSAIVDWMEWEDDPALDSPGGERRGKGPFLAKEWGFDFLWPRAKQA